MLCENLAHALSFFFWRSNLVNNPLSQFGREKICYKFAIIDCFHTLIIHQASIGFDVLYKFIENGHIFFRLLAVTAQCYNIHKLRAAKKIPAEER